MNRNRPILTMTAWNDVVETRVAAGSLVLLVLSS